MVEDTQVSGMGGDNQEAWDMGDMDMGATWMLKAQDRALRERKGWEEDRLAILVSGVDQSDHEAYLERAVHPVHPRLLHH